MIFCNLPSLFPFFLSSIAPDKSDKVYEALYFGKSGLQSPNEESEPSSFYKMVGKYKVITLCGSTRFKDQFLEVQKKLTLEGNIVISVGLFGHSGDEEVWTEGTKEMLDDMHKRKIDMADEIFVINVNKYIGESTRSEIDYALAHNKKVSYLEKNE